MFPLNSFSLIVRSQIVKLEEAKRYGERGSANLLWGLGAPSPQRGPGAEPVVRAPEAVRLFCFWTLDRPAELVGFFSISQRSVWFSF